MADGRLVFLGEIEAHPDFGEIGPFLKRHGVGFVSMRGLPLFDGGSLFFL